MRQHKGRIIRVVVQPDHHHQPAVKRWVEVLGSERLTGATLDRLTHRCHIIESNGESYRLKDARRRREGNASSKASESEA